MEKCRGSEKIANQIVQEVIGGNLGSNINYDQEVKDEVINRVSYMINSIVRLHQEKAIPKSTKIL